MKHKRILLILIVAAGILISAVLVWLTVWSKHEVVGVVERVEPQTCTQNISEPVCGDGVLAVRGENGAITEYKYAADKSSKLNITSLQIGTKVELTVSRGKITKIIHTEE